MARSIYHVCGNFGRKSTIGLYFFFAWLMATGAMGSNSTPAVNFTKQKSIVTEKNGRIELKVIFSHVFSGRLAYRVEGGTADPDADFKFEESDEHAKSGDFATVMPVHEANETNIVIELQDDELLEDVETIQVTLQPGEGYQLGPTRQHTVSIQDNDANWRVMHDVDGMRFDYGIQFLRKGDNTTATAWSDGLSGLPAGTYPVRLTTATDDRFEAIVGPITTTADQTLLGAELSRTFRLVANRPEDGSRIDYGQPLFGSATETWTSPEGATYLSRRNPIPGTFLMSRTVADVAPADTRVVKTSTETTSPSRMVGLDSECAIDDFWTTSRYTVKPSLVQEFSSMSLDELRDGTPTSQVSGSFGQPFASSIPFPNFVDETLGRARHDLYYDAASTQAGKEAAFRYKALLYKKEKVDAETYIRAQFDEIEKHWDCAARKRAHQAAQSLIGALRFVPWNRELRWALLDIYHDIAVADKTVARQRHAAVAEAMLKELVPGESLIHQEISHLEQALVLYRYALAGYMHVLHQTFGVDVADFESDPELQDASLGYHIFRAEVPSRAPLSASFEKGVGEARGEPLVEGYKDVTLLFELLREYLQAAAQLSKRYMLRNDPSDSKRAERLIGSALLATWLEGNALLAIFPEMGEPGAAIGPSSGAREAVAGWRQSYSALGQVRSFLRGDANILGFTDDTLVLTQSTIPGDPKTRFFHTYDFLSQYMRDDRTRSPLQRAITDLDEARRDYDNYRHRSDELAQQLSARDEQYDSRLREIVGARPGETGYDRPGDNEGGLIRQRLLSIEAATLRIERNRQRIENLEEAVRIEVRRRGQEKGINDAISNVYVDFGGKQVELTRKIAQIRQDQMDSSNKASVFGSWLGYAAGILLAPATGGASLMLTAGSAASFISGAINASEQAGTEIEKGEKQALKEQYAAQERAEVHSLQDQLLDANSRARVKTLLLDMSVLALDSREAVIALKLEMEQLAALYLEKEDLERRRAESHELLAARYFADPSHRLLKNASLLRSEYSFADAQRWMFLAIRAAEYKWNQTFVHETDDGVFSMRTLFTTRNARELDRLFKELTDWEEMRSVSGRNDNGYKKLSLREDFLGFKDGHTYPEPDGRPTDSITAFQQFISRSENYLDPEDPENPIPGFRVLRFRFSTAFVPDSGGLFLRNRWLEKIKFLRVRLLGGAVSGINSTVDGYLSYGGVSLIRNQNPGSPRPGNPTRWTDESTAYSTRYWYYEDGRWNPKETFGAPISVQVSKDVEVPLDVYEIDAFQEYSVATSEWTLYVAVEKEGHKLVEVEDLTDIEFHINFFWYVRN